MNKRIAYIVVLLLTVVSGSVYGQRRLRHPEMYIGVHGGVMASTVTFSPTVPHMTDITQSCVLGGNGGLVFRYSEQKCCAVQVELNYMQRGWGEGAEATETSEAVNYSRKLHYLELPFLMHIYFGSQTWRGFVNVGPQIGYCLKDDGGKGAKQTEEVHQYATIDNKFDWGIAGGLGAYCRTEKAGLYQLEVRFNYSFGTLFASRSSDYFGQSNPMALSLNFAWMWQVPNIRPKTIRADKQKLETKM